MDASPFPSVEDNDMRAEPVKKAAVMVLSVLLIAFLLCVGRALWNEDRPIVVLWSMFRLEATGVKVVPLTSDARRLISKAGSDEPVVGLLRERGWSLVDKLGAGIFFEKQGMRLNGSIRTITRRYTVYEFDKSP